MEIYLVGGAVRDGLLKLPVEERDWVVIGETAESMLRQGFRPVGKDFPVFLHPGTHEEYALARTERKTAPGYRGFAVNAAPDVTLEQDLLRRDLTINAMAMAADGRLVDPYGGRADLQKRLLRHVSPAFAEDPVRILRIARFAARYRPLGFTVAPETNALMRQMVAAGEADSLVPERVWAELAKALKEPCPAAFFETLRYCGALAAVFPEIDRLFGVPQPEKHHPDKAIVRFAALTHDLGKGATPPENWPHHYGHEQKGLDVLEAMCARLRVPNAFKALARQVAQYHTHCHKAFELRPGTLTDTLAALGAFKPRHSLDDFLLACEADARGRTGLEERPYPQSEFMRGAAQAGAAADTAAILNSGLNGPEIGEAIRRLRIEAISDFRGRQLADRATSGSV
jgi:tRNA nucleotidyltransferase (CCA-adding enzyme)